MAVIIPDVRIKSLLEEPKPLPSNYQARLALRQKRGHKERDLAVEGQNGNNFRILMRQSDADRLDFSVVLVWDPPDTNDAFRLKRYNGRSHEHTNKIEGEKFYAFHIHTATERYQQLGAKEDAFAEATDRYADITGAFECLLADCGFEMPPAGAQQILPFGDRQ
jgi:hypothetical protein